MGDVTSKAFYSRTWRDLRRGYCAIVCTWQEILLWIALWLLIIVTAWVIYELVVVESIFWGSGVLGFLIVTSLVVIILLLVMLGLSLLHDQVWTPLKTKWLECWQGCRSVPSVGETGP